MRSSILGLHTRHPLQPGKVINVAGTAATRYDGVAYGRASASDLGLIDTKLGIISFWVLLQGGNGTNMNLFANSSLKPRLRRRNVDDWEFIARNAAGTNILQITSDTGWTDADPWHHVFFTWDLGQVDKSWIYVNGVDVTVRTTHTDDTMDLVTHAGNEGFGAADNGGDRIDACISEYYVRLGEFLDLGATPSLINSFISGGKPVDLGADGSLPTGNVPQMFSPDGDCRINAGSGAGMPLIAGSLSACASTPG